MIPPFNGQLFEILTFASLAAWQGGKTIASIIANDDWAKITGPNGVAFIAVCAVITLWVANLRREKREEASRDARHKELIEANKEATSALTALTEKSVDALVESSGHHAESASAMRTLSNNISLLTYELKRGKEKGDGNA